jgi:hypothetical protein
MDWLWSEIENVKNFNPIAQALLAGMLIALFFACVRSLRMSRDKLRTMRTKSPSIKTVEKMLSCPAGATHNFPAVKRGRTAKCRNCPATFTRR